jgi:hypothetical protein
LNQHNTPELIFYTKTKTVTSRWPPGINDGDGDCDTDDAVGITSAIEAPTSGWRFLLNYWQFSLTFW